MAINPRLTPAAYLAYERQQTDAKHEYLDGQLTAMTGASLAHNRIVSNVTGMLYTQFRGRACDHFSNDMRVYIPKTGLYTYPDIVALCAPPEFEDELFDTLLNPSVIIEVLSPSTEAYDRGNKFTHYRSIPSLQTYLLISQNHPACELFERQPDGRWILSDAEGLDRQVTLAAIGCELALAAIYERVFEEPPH